jgi:hypothetical protein
MFQIKNSEKYTVLSTGEKNKMNMEKSKYKIVMAHEVWICLQMEANNIHEMMRYKCIFIPRSEHGDGNANIILTWEGGLNISI